MYENLVRKCAPKMKIQMINKDISEVKFKAKAVWENTYSDIRSFDPQIFAWIVSNTRRWLMKMPKLKTLMKGKGKSHR